MKRRNSGHAFESELDTICAQYQMRGLLRLKKVEQPIKTFGHRVIHLENPFLDYVGIWTERGGRMVCIEAKSTKEPRLPLGASGLTERQMTNLRLWEKSGAVAFLLWTHAGSCRLWTNQMIDRDYPLVKHLKFDSGIVVPQGTGFVTHDFRAVMLKLWNT